MNCPNCGCIDCDAIHVMFCVGAAERRDKAFALRLELDIMSILARTIPVAVETTQTTEATGARCRGCGAPIQSAGYCAYCDRRLNFEPFADQRPDTVSGRQARARMALMDKRERPRETATSRMMKLPHPWTGDDE